MELVNDVLSSKNRKGFSRGPGHLKSVCCLITVEMEEVVLTLWEDLWSSKPSEKASELVQLLCGAIAECCGSAPQQRSSHNGWEGSTESKANRRNPQSILHCHLSVPSTSRDIQEMKESLLGQAVSKHHLFCCLTNSTLRHTEQILSNITKPRDEHQMLSLYWMSSQNRGWQAWDVQEKRIYGGFDCGLRATSFWRGNIRGTCWHSQPCLGSFWYRHMCAGRDPALTNPAGEGEWTSRSNYILFIPIFCSSCERGLFVNKRKHHLHSSTTRLK